MCPTQIDARGVQTVQTDSALTTWFGRPDFLGVITDDSIKWLKWGKNLPTRLWQLCRVSFRAAQRQFFLDSFRAAQKIQNPMV